MPMSLTSEDRGISAIDEDLLGVLCEKGIRVGWEVQGPSVIEQRLPTTVP